MNVPSSSSSSSSSTGSGDTTPPAVVVGNVVAHEEKRQQQQEQERRSSFSSTELIAQAASLLAGRPSSTSASSSLRKPVGAVLVPPPPPQQQQKHLTVVHNKQKNNKNKKVQNFWTYEEKEAFREALEEHGTDWTKLGDAVPNRTESALKSHYYYLRNVKPPTTTRVIAVVSGTSWSAHEKESFQLALGEHGTSNWRKLQEWVPTRSINALKGYYKKKLKKRTTVKKAKKKRKKSPRRNWTEVETAAFETGLSLYGPTQMSKVAAMIPTRTLKQVRRHYKAVYDKKVYHQQEGGGGDEDNGSAGLKHDLFLNYNEDDDVDEEREEATAVATEEEKNLKRGRNGWTEEEKRAFRLGLAKYGGGGTTLAATMSQIAETIPTRSKQQCTDHYYSVARHETIDGDVLLESNDDGDDDDFLFDDEEDEEDWEPPQPKRRRNAVEPQVATSEKTPQVATSEKTPQVATATAARVSPDGSNGGRWVDAPLIPRRMSSGNTATVVGREQQGTGGGGISSLEGFLRDVLYDPDEADVEAYAGKFRSIGLHSVAIIQMIVTAEHVHKKFDWMKTFHRLAFVERAGLKK